MIVFYDDKRVDSFRWGRCRFITFAGLLSIGQMILWLLIYFATNHFNRVESGLFGNGQYTVLICLIAYWFLINKLQWGFEFRALDAEVGQAILMPLVYAMRTLIVISVLFVNVWIYAILILLFVSFVTIGAWFKPIQKTNFYGAYQQESKFMQGLAILAIGIILGQIYWMVNIIFSSI